METKDTSPQSKRNADRGEVGSKPTTIFQFLDYRKFLSHWLEARKQAQPSYSGSMFAKKAGIASHSLLGMVIRGDRNLSPTTIRAFIRGLNLNGKSALYFEKLVLFNQSEISDDRSYYFDQLKTIAGTQTSALVTEIADMTSYLSSWYAVAIRELVSTRGFKSDPQWISKRLKGKITPKQAEETWNLLVRLNMVTCDTQTNTWKVQDNNLDFDPGKVNFAIRNYHKNTLKRVEESIESEAINERSLSTMTLTIKKHQYEGLCERINEFRKSLATEMGSSTKDDDDVVLISTQILKLTGEHIS